jgi:hypothetical protein
MNRTLSYGAKLLAHLDPSKGVDAYRQQDGGQPEQYLPWPSTVSNSIVYHTTDVSPNTSSSTISEGAIPSNCGDVLIADRLYKLSDATMDYPQLTPPCSKVESVHRLSDGRRALATRTHPSQLSSLKI